MIFFIHHIDVFVTERSFRSVDDSGNVAGFCSERRTDGVDGLEKVSGLDFNRFRERAVSDGFFDAEESSFTAGVFDLGAGEAGCGGREVAGTDGGADAHG